MRDTNWALKCELLKLASWDEPDLGMEDLPESEYLVSKTFEVVTPESAEEGEAADSGYDIEDERWEESDVIHELQNGYIHPSSSSLDSLRWVSTEGEPDYSDGSNTTYSLHVRNPDGSEIDGDTWRHLLSEAGILSSMHLSAMGSMGPCPSCHTNSMGPNGCENCGAKDTSIGNKLWSGAKNVMNKLKPGDPNKPWEGGRKMFSAVGSLCQTPECGEEAEPNGFCVACDPEFVPMLSNQYYEDQARADYEEEENRLPVDTESDTPAWNDTMHRWAAAKDEKEEKSNLEPANKDSYCADPHPQQTTGGWDKEACFAQKDISHNTKTSLDDRADELALLSAQLSHFKQ